MAEANSSERLRAYPLVPAVMGDFTVGTMVLLGVALLSLFALYRQRPPQAVAANAPATVFSSGRAMKYLENITRRSHPIGTLEHLQVRQYILNELTTLGLEPEVQDAMVVNANRSNALRAATVHNIIARLRGTSSSKAVLVSGHYDTVPNGPGASDDGSAVAAMLETIRALKAGPALKNDLIFLFTDGEEIGMFGAQAFISEHPLAKGIGVALNFEARGSSGPAFMFETSNENSWLINEFAQAAPAPYANSLAYEIYKWLPNDTDFTVFKAARLPGLNFAFIDGFRRYHSQADSIENIDERSLQHQGSYALALTRRFGDSGLNETKDSNSVYFDLLGGLAFFHYSIRWVLPLTILLTVLFVMLVGLGIKRGRLTLSGIAGGCLAFVLSLIAASLAVTFIWWLIRMTQGWLGRSLQDDFYESKLYFVGFAAISVAIVACIYNLFRKRVGDENLAVGALLCCLILEVLSSLLLPGGSYLLTWPLLFSIVALMLIFALAAQKTASLKHLILLCVGAMPAIILIVPAIYQIAVALDLNGVGAMAALVALLLGFLIQPLMLVAASKKWLIPGVAMLLGVGFIATACLAFRFDKQYPKADNLFYALNADTGQAIWASSDPTPDNWTTQFLSANPEKGSVLDFAPTNSGDFLKHSAPAALLAPSQVQLLDDSTTDDVRTLRIKIIAPQQVASIVALVEPKTEVLAAAVNGKQVDNRGVRASQPASAPWTMQYWALPENGIELTLQIKATQPLRLKIVDRSYGLPEIPGAHLEPRPKDMMPAPFSNSDSTLVSKSYTF